MTMRYFQSRQMDSGAIAEGSDLEKGSPEAIVNDSHFTEETRSSSEVASAERLNPTVSGSQRPLPGRRYLTSALILLVGIAASAIILGFGIQAARNDQEKRFQRIAKDVFLHFERAWTDYTTAALWVQQAVQQAEASGKMTREEFHSVYEYISSTRLAFHGISYAPMVLQNERSQLENETSAFFQVNYPSYVYHGFIDIGDGNFKPQTEQPSYFPTHFVEPMEQNWQSVDIDLYSHPFMKLIIDAAMSEMKFSLSYGTAPLAKDAAILTHPGIRLSNNLKPRGVSVLSIFIPQLLTEIATHNPTEESVSVYLYDFARPVQAGPPFLGGATFHQSEFMVANHEEEHDATDHVHAIGEVLTFIEQESIEKLRQSANMIYEGSLNIASSQWTIAVVPAEESAFRPRLAFLVLAACMILVACICLALWVYTDYQRVIKISETRSAAEAEKAAIVVDHARKAARHERELNDFIAHEVRNPLAAAITACSFVSSTIKQPNPMSDTKSRESVEEDIGIIYNSLHFMNDLLRNMLDMQRAASNQIRIKLTHTDLLRDVFEPVASMLYHRCNNFKVLVDCPKNLVVMADTLRLKQVILNLSQNASKFVLKGFIRMRAAVVDNKVQLYVEDSGPGIPLEKRTQLFSKYQESLDSLHQGTGIGLCVCRNLVGLMGGDIYLDETYRSGVEGYPGACFVVNLNKPAVSLNSIAISANGKSVRDVTPTSSGPQKKTTVQTVGQRPHELPEKVSILFVDDDMLLRKLFTRSVRKVAPSWDIQEAANGETALRLVDEAKFDLIFMDQYMASFEKQLLGTETVLALRAKGVKSRICGLSANDLEKPFLQAGADFFIIKPFPCQKDALIREFMRLLSEEKEALQDGTESTESIHWDE